MAFFAVLVVVIVVACKSQLKNGKSEDASPDLAGTWELREAQNGMIPTVQHAAGNGNRWQFSGNNFEQFADGNRVRQGSFTLVADSTVSASVGLELPVTAFTHRIIFTGDTTEKTFVHLRGDTMEMVSGFFPVDAGSRQVYVRMAGKGDR